MASASLIGPTKTSVFASSSSVAAKEAKASSSRVGSFTGSTMPKWATTGPAGSSEAAPRPHEPSAVGLTPSGATAPPPKPEAPSASGGVSMAKGSTATRAPSIAPTSMIASSAAVAEETRKRSDNVTTSRAIKTP